MAFTDEQRRKALETRAKNREAKQAGTAVAIPEAPTETQANDLLASLGAALANAAGKEREQDKILDQISALLGKLDASKFKALASNPAVQQLVDVVTEREADRHPDDPPGTIYNRGKVNESKKPWTWRDVNVPEGINPPSAPGDGREWVEWTANETIPITFQGLTWYVRADEPVRTPKVFRDVYLEHKGLDKFAREHAAFLFRQTDRATHPDMVSRYTMAGARARAMGEGGFFKPGAGPIDYSGDGGFKE